jgi:hypothetical protein
MESGAMISQRRIAQCGLLAATAVFVTSLGILISQNGEPSQKAAPVQTVSADSHERQNQPLTLSASADSSTANADQH